jgi:hypothetical protein
MLPLRATQTRPSPPIHMPQVGKLWYRGGCYKFFQALALLVCTIAWLGAAVPVTKNGIKANELTTNEYMVSSCVGWLTTYTRYHATRQLLGPAAWHSICFLLWPTCLQILRYVLIGVCFANMGFMLLGLLIRLVEKPGKIRQADLDALVAEKLANQQIAYLHHVYGREACRGWGGVQYARKAITADLLEK